MMVLYSSLSSSSLLAFDCHHFLSNTLLFDIDHYSTVTMELSQSINSTTIKFKQEGVPIGEQDSTRANWNNYYWNEIKRTFGYVRLSSSSSQSAPSPSNKKKRRHRRVVEKAGGGGGGGAVGLYAGAGLAVLTAFVLGFWFSKK